MQLSWSHAPGPRGEVGTRPERLHARLSRGRKREWKSHCHVQGDCGQTAVDLTGLTCVRISLGLDDLPPGIRTSLASWYLEPIVRP